MVKSTTKNGGDLNKNANDLSELGRAAVRYAGMGMAVFPLWPGKKNPVPKNGLYAATTDIDTITAWWKESPDYNIGIACGSSSGGLLVIDIDTKGAVDGYDSIHEWESMNGSLPDPTVRCITPSGGSHIYYKVDRKEGNRASIIPAVDVRGDGGYVVAPPSVFDGNRYEWEFDPEEYQITEADDTVYKFLAEGKKSQGGGKALAVPEKVTEGSRNDFIYRRACQLQALDWTDDAILRACLAENEQRLEPPLDPDEVEKAVASALKREKGSIAEKKFRGIDLITDFDNKGHSKIRQCAENVFRVIAQDPELAGRIKYDTFNYRIMYLGQLPWKEEGDTFGTWQEADDAELRNYLDMKYGLHVRNNYDDGFKIVVSRNKYNPLTGYLNALKWDGVHRIDTLLPDYLGADRNEYTSGVLHTFLQGMMHRAFCPGKKFDYMLVIVGPQGKGKSTFLRYLACRDEWYSEDFNFKSTDSKSTIELMEGKWLLEMGEMATLKKDSLSADNIKAFITNMSDKYRVPYEKRSEDRKRQCVFAGTSNDVNFLKDRTGGRRFLPVVIHPEKIIKDIRDEKAARPEFEQAIAEAVHYYKEHPDERPMLSDELTEYAEKMQRQHLEEDGWVSMIQDYLDSTTRDRVNSACIWVNAFDKAEPDMKRADSSRILTIMRNDIEGWREVGKTRCNGFGRSLICFERDAGDPDEELSGTGFEQMADDADMLF